MEAWRTFIFFISITQHCLVYNNSINACYMLILQNGNTPLLTACRYGYLGIVRCLIEYGCDKEKRTTVMIDIVSCVWWYSSIYWFKTIYFIIQRCLKGNTEYYFTSLVLLKRYKRFYEHMLWYHDNSEGSFFYSKQSICL